MRISVHPTLYIYLLSMFVFSSWETCIGAAVALFVHELGHCIVCCIVHESIERLELTPFGGVMIYQQGKSPCKGLKGFCVAAAGPAANYFLLAYIHSIAGYMDIVFVRSIISSCTVMMIINLLPALPLDGGRMIFCIGYYVFPLSALITFLTAMGVIVGIGFLTLAVYGIAAGGILNCSVIIIGGYLIYCSWRCREQMLLENLVVVIQEAGDNKRDIQKVKTYRIPTDVLLIRLLPYLGGRNICEFVFDVDEQEYRLSERALYQFLLSDPAVSVYDVLKNTRDP